MHFMLPFEIIEKQQQRYDDRCAAGHSSELCLAIFCNSPNDADPERGANKMAKPAAASLHRTRAESQRRQPT
jgi:hypothetical protein